MKGTTALAIAVCIACFFIGYLSFLAVTFFVDYFVGQLDLCRNSVAVCSQQQAGR